MFLFCIIIFWEWIVFTMKKYVCIFPRNSHMNFRLSIDFRCFFPKNISKNVMVRCNFSSCFHSSKCWPFEWIVWIQIISLKVICMWIFSKWFSVCKIISFTNCEVSKKMSHSDVTVLNPYQSTTISIDARRSNFNYLLTPSGLTKIICLVCHYMKWKQCDLKINHIKWVYVYFILFI